MRKGSSSWWNAAQGELAALGVLAGPLVAVATAAERAADGRGAEALQDPTFALDVLADVPHDAFPADRMTAVVGRVLDFLHDRATTEELVAAAEPEGVRWRPDPTATASPPVDGAPPIYVQLIGTYRISVFGVPMRTGLLRSARELFAYFLLHPHGGTIDGLVETLWPDTRAKSATDKFWNAVRSLRHRLRTATGIVGLNIVEHHGEVYRLDTAHLLADLWSFETALADMHDATATGIDVQTLEEAAAHCQGQLLDGCPYEWVGPSREGFRRRALDVLSRIADHHVGAGNRSQAFAVLEQAISLDPLDEEFYQRAIRLYVSDGAIGAAHRLYRELEARLGPLDLKPSATTRAVLDEVGC